MDYITDEFKCKTVRYGAYQAIQAMKLGIASEILPGEENCNIPYHEFLSVVLQSLVDLLPDSDAERDRAIARWTLKKANEETPIRTEFHDSKVELLKHLERIDGRKHIEEWSFHFREAEGIMVELAEKGEMLRQYRILDETIIKHLTVPGMEVDIGAFI